MMAFLRAKKEMVLLIFCGWGCFREMYWRKKMVAVVFDLTKMSFI